MIWRIFWCLEIKPPLFWSLKKLSEIKYGKDLLFWTRFILLTTYSILRKLPSRRGLNKELSSSFSSTLFWDYLLKPVIWQHALYYVFKRREGFTYKQSWLWVQVISPFLKNLHTMGWNPFWNIVIISIELFFHEKFSAQIFECK